MIDIRNMSTEDIENFDWDSLSSIEKEKAIKLLEEESQIKKNVRTI